jgi:hypothetical protein
MWFQQHGRGKLVRWNLHVSSRQHVPVICVGEFRIGGRQFRPGFRAGKLGVGEFRIAGRQFRFGFQCAEFRVARSQ